MQVLKGQAVSAGIAIGPVVVLDPRGLGYHLARSRPRQSLAELERLDRGLDAAKSAAAQDKAEARTRLGPQYADILAAHCRMIADPTLRADARKIIEHEHASAEHAVLDVLEKLVSGWNGSPGSHLSARRRRRPRHRGANLEPLDRRASQVVSGQPGRASYLAGPRSDSQ